jgi:L-2-hydroxyglutarate oxidase LhgO
MRTVSRGCTTGRCRRRRVRVPHACHVARAVEWRLRVETETRDGDRFAIDADLLVNSAGLEADRIAGYSGSRDTLHWCKGCYCSVRSSKARLCSRLVYPAVPKYAPGLGIHVALDLDGACAWTRY